MIAGYTVCNDIPVRDWNMGSPTMTIGKSFDTTEPTGPWIVTDDEINGLHDLLMRLFVHGELRQSDSTSVMVHKVYDQIAHLSAVTLHSGNLTATGTPSGFGFAMTAQGVLKVGDVVRAEIDYVGFIENTAIAEPVEQ